MRPADRAWLALTTGVVIWDLACPNGEMLSEASARYAKDHPLAAYGVIAVVGLHLVNRVPKRVDPVHWIGVWLRGMRHGLQRTAA